MQLPAFKGVAQIHIQHCRNILVKKYICTAQFFNLFI